MVARPPRPRLFGHETADAAAVIRGAMLDRLEKSFQCGVLHTTLQQDSDDERLRDFGEKTYHGLLVLLFPEEYELPAAFSPGLCPPQGPPRCGADRLKAFAELLAGSARNGDSRP